MDVVVDADGHPAPRLVDAAIPVQNAASLYEDLRQQVVKMLLCDLIHGDLSPYNVLLAWNGPTIIDFPQVVGAAHNNRAEFFFRRDLEALREFFARVDPALQSRASDAREIWRAYVRRELTEDFIPPRQSQPASTSRPDLGHEPGREAPRKGERHGRRRRRGPRGGQPHGDRQHSHPRASEEHSGQQQRRQPPQEQQQRPVHEKRRAAEGPLVSYKGQVSGAQPPKPADPNGPPLSLAGEKRRRRRRRGRRGASGSTGSPVRER
jgi:RIO kinase 1